MSDRELNEMDTDCPDDLPEDERRSLDKQLLRDLKEARERLKQSPETSSHLPSSREPRKASQAEGALSDKTPARADLAPRDTTESSAGESTNPDSARPPAVDDNSQPKKAGRRTGSPRHSRNLTMPVTQTRVYYPFCCNVYEQSFAEAADCRLFNVRYKLELEVGKAEAPTLQIDHRRHEYYAATGDCGHESHAEPRRCADEAGWGVTLTEWHLAARAWSVFWSVCRCFCAYPGAKLKPSYVIGWG